MPPYRKQALAAQACTGLDDIVLIRPLSLALFTAVLAGFVTAVCLFLAFGSDAKRATLSRRWRGSSPAPRRRFQ